MIIQESAWHAWHCVWVDHWLVVGAVNKPPSGLDPLGAGGPVEWCAGLGLGLGRNNIIMT